MSAPLPVMSATLPMSPALVVPGVLMSTFAPLSAGVANIVKSPWKVWLAGSDSVDVFGPGTARPRLGYGRGGGPLTRTSRTVQPAGRRPRPGREHDSRYQPQQVTSDYEE